MRRYFLFSCDFPRSALLLLNLSVYSGISLASHVPFSDGKILDGDFDGTSSVFASDMDGDGDMDVLGAAFLDDAIAWWENTVGDGSVWSKHTVDGNFDSASSVFATDVDGDGDMDVLGTALDADDITWWENTAGDGSAWTEHLVDGDFDGADSVYAADVDGDGDIDILGAARHASDIIWWENTAGDASTWSKHILDGNFLDARAVFATDVDGDGDMDVLGAASNAHSINWWENTTGDGSTWSKHNVSGFFLAAVSVYAEDVDGDGDMDVLGTAAGAHDITWWENTAGDGSAWSGHTINDNFNLPVSVFATDVDGDGDTDVLGTAFLGDDITWWENTTGDGSAWTEHTIDGDFDGAGSLYATDIDGDGDKDILGAASVAGDITWWENQSPIVKVSDIDNDFLNLLFLIKAIQDGGVSND